MSRFCILVKNNLKLLLRNKGFLFFLVVLPLLSLLLLNVREGSVAQDTLADPTQVYEVDSSTTKLIYISNPSYYTIKVIDGSNSKLTDQLLKELASTGLFNVFVYKTEQMTKEQVSEMAEENASNDRIGVVVYVSKQFEEEALSGNITDTVSLFSIGEDSRFYVFESNLSVILSSFSNQAKEASNDVTKFLSLEEKAANERITASVQSVTISESEELTTKQMLYKEHLGYSFAIMTLAFLFCGIFIAYTVMEERQNKVLTRILLTNADERTYILSKLSIAVLVSILQTGIIAIGVCFLVQPEFGISRISYIILIFLLGLIFNTLSLCVGVVSGNAMAANYAVFTIWSLSSLLAGLYFSMEQSSTILRNVANLMPQKWFLKAAEMLMKNEHGVYLMILSVTVSYLAVILCISAAGLKAKREV